MNASGLGHLQQKILSVLQSRLRLYRQTQIGSRHAVELGLFWRVHGSNARHASASRALKSLERRGLVTRRKGPAGRRTVAVWLRPEIVENS
jgi:hypothetical protein